MYFVFTVNITITIIVGREDIKLVIDAGGISRKRRVGTYFKGKVTEWYFIAKRTFIKIGWLSGLY